MPNWRNFAKSGHTAKDWAISNFKWNIFLLLKYWTFYWRCPTSVSSQIQILTFQTFCFATFQSLFSKKMIQSRPLFCFHFASFQTNIEMFTTNRYICEKISIQYTVLGFEPRAFGKWVSYHNHYTRAWSYKGNFPRKMILRYFSSILIGWKYLGSNQNDCKNCVA